MGVILLYSGAALLAATVILAIVFAVKKPQYRPEHAAYAGGEERGAGKAPAAPGETVPMPGAAGPQPPSGTEVMPSQGQAAGTVPMVGEPVPLARADETVPLFQGGETVPMPGADETQPLAGAGADTGERP